MIKSSVDIRQLNIQIMFTRCGDYFEEVGIVMNSSVVKLDGDIAEKYSDYGAPDELNMDLMTTEEIRNKLEKGYNDAMAGNVQEAESVFEYFRRNHGA